MGSLPQIPPQPRSASVSIHWPPAFISRHSLHGLHPVSFVQRIRPYLPVVAVNGPLTGVYGEGSQPLAAGEVADNGNLEFSWR